jgi:hypothetical protein
MNQNKTKKNQFRTKPKFSNKQKQTNFNNTYTSLGTRIPLRPSDIMPPNITKTLNYIDGNYQRTNSGSNYLVYAIRVNDCYDPDPLILSGSISGFKELMQFYTTYRVSTSHIHLKIANQEAFPLIYGYVYGQTSLVGVISNRDDAINALENDFSTRGRLLAAKGGIDTEEISSSIDLSLLLGNKKQYTAEIAYTGQGLATPVIPLYCNLIIASPTAATIPNGVITALTVSFNTNFFGRTNLRA